MKFLKIKVKIDTPKFSIKKYKDDGSIDYISPIPFLVNYGSCPEIVGGDGDFADAIVVGKKLPRGWIGELPERGGIKFVDNGEEDFKYIFSGKEITLMDKVMVYTFFTLFAMFKWTLNKLRGKKGKTGIIKITFNP